jgi:exonuclease VII small subunit
MDQPAGVSVCIPTYNGEEFVVEAVASVLAQGFSDFELVVVDDGSKDATLDIVHSFADPRIRVFQNTERLGIPGNWNRCLTLAQRELFCLFHQDDVMLPDNLERKVEVLAADSMVSLVYSRAELVVEDSAPTPPDEWMEKSAADFIVEGDVYFRKLLFQGNLICAPTVVARRSLLLAVGGFDEALGFACDYEMWMKMCIEHRVAFLSQPLVRYRWHGKNASHAYRFERGVDDTVAAGRQAVQHYLQKTGRQEEIDILHEALTALAQLRRWAAELDRGREWWGEQATRLQEQQQWIQELEQGKAWLEEQRANWQRVVAEQATRLQEQQQWIQGLEQGKAWLEEQRANWQRVVVEQATRLQEQQRWIQELEQGKAWLEEQVRHWRTKAEQLQGVIEQWRRQWIPQPLKKIVTDLLRSEGKNG